MDHLVWIALALIWILSHTFVGIQHDARIYMGRAMADLDPAGVGRDVVFALDGQSAFTLFRPLAKGLVAILGLEPAAAVLTLTTLVIWVAALVVFVRAIIPGRAALLVLLVAIVLPRVYAPWDLLQAGESGPIPRPIAEACVLLGLAALCRGRPAVGFGCLVAAALFHPIMAAPGFVVLFASLARRDWRWIAAGLLAGGAILAAAFLGAPFISRLFVVIDPAWRAILAERCPCLWVRLWPGDVYARLAIQAITILIACAFLDRAQRFLLVSVLLIGLAGVAASLILADTFSSTLALQAQLWRALWLPAVLAPVAAGICVWRLPSLGRAGLIALSLLALAWTAASWVPLGLAAAGAAFACVALHRFRPFSYSRTIVITVAVACGALIILIEAIPVLALAQILVRKPTGASLPSALIWSTGVMIVPVIVFACLWWYSRPTAATRMAAGFAVAGLLCVTALKWDSRLAAQRADRSGPQMTTLRTMLASGAGEVLWLEDDHAWAWLGRPSWGGHAQGAAIVFSRALAMKWHDRTLAMIAHGLGDATLISPWRRDVTHRKPDLAKADLSGLCGRPDAPAWIVAPIQSGQAVPSVPGVRVWIPGFVDWALSTGQTGVEWISYDRYAVVPCAQGIG